MTLPLFNAETLLSGRTNDLIDLTKVDWTLDIVAEKMPDGMYWASDRATFDGDPESKWHITGRGRTKIEAIRDLFWGIMEATQEPEQRYEKYMGVTAGVEPNDLRPVARDPFEDDE